MSQSKKKKPTGEQPPQQTMQLVDAASLDAKINAIRGAWTEVEIRRLKRKEELKSYNDRITATSDQLAGMCRNDRVESLELFVDTCRGLQLKIDKLEGERDACATRWKARLEEAEEIFRNNLFGEQLPLLLAAGTDTGADPSPIVDAPPGAPQQVVALTLEDNRMLRVGGRVMIHGAGAHRPGVVLELEDRGPSKKHGALVRYDGDDPTPAHVMAHQCHPLDGLEGEPARPKRGKRSRKDAEESEADAVAGELDVEVLRWQHDCPKAEGSSYTWEAPFAPGLACPVCSEPCPHAAPTEPPAEHEPSQDGGTRHPASTKGRTPKPLELGDRVVMIDDTSEMSDSIGTIEALTGEDHKGRMASVRWDLHDDRLHDVYVLHLRRSTKKDESELAPHYEAARAKAAEASGEPAKVDVTPITKGRRTKPAAKAPPDDVA